MKKRQNDHSFKSICNRSNDEEARYHQKLEAQLFEVNDVDSRIGGLFSVRRGKVSEAFRRSKGYRVG
jgi:hypothetical protein